MGWMVFSKERDTHFALISDPSSNTLIPAQQQAPVPPSSSSSSPPLPNHSNTILTPSSFLNQYPSPCKTAASTSTLFLLSAIAQDRRSSRSRGDGRHCPPALHPATAPTEPPGTRVVWKQSKESTKGKTFLCNQKHSHIPLTLLPPKQPHN